MALVACKECGARISAKAAACPSCGAAPPKKTKAATWFIGGLVAFAIGGSILRSNQEDRLQQSAAKPSPALQVGQESDTQRAAAVEKRRIEVEASCTTGLPALLADAKKLLADGDPTMAAARLNLCKGVSSDPGFVAAYATAERRRVEKIAQATRDEKARKRREGVSIGMSKDDVLASSWGKPQKINTTTTATTTREQWVYGLRSYLYFTGDTLVTIQN